MLKRAVNCQVPTGYQCGSVSGGSSTTTCTSPSCASGYSGSPIGGATVCTSGRGSWSLSGCSGTLNQYVRIRRGTDQERYGSGEVRIGRGTDREKYRSGEERIGRGTDQERYGSGEVRMDTLQSAQPSVLRNGQPRLHLHGLPTCCKGGPTCYTPCSFRLPSSHWLPVRASFRRFFYNHMRVTFLR